METADKAVLRSEKPSTNMREELGKGIEDMSRVPESEEVAQPEEQQTPLSSLINTTDRTIPILAADPSTPDTEVSIFRKDEAVEANKDVMR